MCVGFRRQFRFPVTPQFLECLSVIGSPLLSTLCEKSPLFSSAVGIIKNLVAAGASVGQISCEKKKNNLLLSELNLPGQWIGPPMLYPIVLKRFLGLGRPL